LRRRDRPAVRIRLGAIHLASRNSRLPGIGARLQHAFPICNRAIVNGAFIQRDQCLVAGSLRWRPTVKRIIILTAAALLGGVLNAQADIDTWVNIAKYPRGDAALQVDAHSCEQSVGQNTNGKPTSRRFKQCMAGRGWRFDHSTYQHVAPERTWIDPDTGLLCKQIKVFGNVTGSYCSND
jgi:hypothetical protein